MPSAVGLWQGLRHLSDEIAFYLARFRPIRSFVLSTLSQIVRDAALVLALLFIAFKGLPLLAGPLHLSYLAAPMPLLVLVALALIAFVILSRMQHQLVEVFSHTFMGSVHRPEFKSSLGIKTLLPRNLAMAWKTPATRRALLLRAGIATGIIAVLAASWAVGYMITARSAWWFL